MKKYFVFSGVVFVVLFSFFISAFLLKEKREDVSSVVSILNKKEEKIVSIEKKEKEDIKKNILAKKQNIFLPENVSDLDIDDFFDNKTISLPHDLMSSLSITEVEIWQNINKYKNQSRHHGWLGRIEAVLGNEINQEQKQAMRNYQLIFLRLGDELKLRYLKGEIFFEDFQRDNLSLFAWHQDRYLELLNNEQYQKLFEVAPEDTFEILSATLLNNHEDFGKTNDNISLEEIEKNIAGYKIDILKNKYREYVFKAYQFGNMVENKEISPEQAVEMENYEYQFYLEEAQSILDPNEYLLVFGTNI